MYAGSAGPLFAFTRSRDLPHVKLLRLLVTILLAFWVVRAHAQPPPAGESSSATLPDAPGSRQPGTVTGRVLYSDSQPVYDARVTLQPASGPALTTTTDADGSFVFLRVPPGAFTVRAEADGLSPTSTTGDLLAAGGVDLAPIILPIAAVVTQVNAISEKEAAEEQVQMEEQQRIAGLIPNFLVVYDDNAIPLSPGQKFRLSARTLIDPSTFVVSALIAGGEQAGNSYPSWGRGMSGYSRRFAASYADGATGMMISSWMLPSILHQDPRFFYQTHGTVRSRIGNVLRQAIEQKGDNGRWQFAWSNTVGGMASAVISSTYYPAQNRTWLGLTAQNFGLGVLSQAIANTLQQFVFNHVTTHRDDPAPANGGSSTSK